jgi:hypothetical protein
VETALARLVMRSGGGAIFVFAGFLGGCYMGARVIKYLYGKSIHLTPFINGETGLRLSDLSHYSRLENEAMRDDELKKTFLLNPKGALLKINDHEIEPDSIVGDVEITISPTNCYCLCLSNRKNSEELYNKFKAEVCLAIDVEKLVNILGAFAGRFPGIQIEHGDVKYFDPHDWIPTSDRKALAFYKPNLFKHESEYRILLRIPESRRAFKAQDGTTVPCFIDGQSMHMEFRFEDSKVNNCCLVEVYHQPSTENS